MLGKEIDKSLKLFSKLPSLGARSSRRIILQLLKKKENLLYPLINALKDMADNIQVCPICGNYDTISPCSNCQDNKKDKSIICVVQDVADLWALERTASYKGQYHVLGGVLSALDGVVPEDLNISKLIDRAKKTEVKEVIIALSATIDGQTTAHYLSSKLKPLDIKISGLAHGVPVGGELDYLDDGTIQMAINSRKEL
jgi:recombination protein RecR